MALSFQLDLSCSMGMQCPKCPSYSDSAAGQILPRLQVTSLWLQYDKPSRAPRVAVPLSDTAHQRGSQCKICSSNSESADSWHENLGCINVTAEAQTLSCSFLRCMLCNPKRATPNFVLTRQWMDILFTFWAPMASFAGQLPVRVLSTSQKGELLLV